MAGDKLQKTSRDGARSVAITNGIAQVSFPGGNMFLPARDPYDRQMLLEHIVAGAHAGRRVRLLVDDLRWTVRLRRAGGTLRGRTTPRS